MKLQYLEDIEKAHSCDGRRHLEARCHPFCPKFAVVDHPREGEAPRPLAIWLFCAVCEARIANVAVESWFEGAFIEGENYAAAVVLDGRLYLGNPPEPPVAALTVARRCELQAPRLLC